MGGFIFFRKIIKETDELIEQKYSSSIEIFQKKGLVQSAKLVNDNFIIYVFNKKHHRITNVYKNEDGGFVCSSGTFIYEGLVNGEALTQFYRDFNQKKDFLSAINGNYCLVIFKNDNLYILNDLGGMYPVYSDESNQVISNSMLAVSKSILKKTIVEQGLYQYILNGAFYAELTPIKEINLLDSHFIYNVSPNLNKIEKEYNFLNKYQSRSFSELVQEIADGHIGYFENLQRNFGNDIILALSGGYDTRLMLALLRAVGVTPKLYVGGADNSADVIIAKHIAKSEGYELDHFRGRSKDHSFKGNPNFFIEKFYNIDGLDSVGVFNHTTNMDLENSKKAILNLFGLSGEIYRNYWRLKNKNYSIKNFLKSYFENMSYDFCNDSFSKKEYFNNLEFMVKDILNISNDILTRDQSEFLLTQMHVKYGASRTVGYLNQYSFSLAPFLEYKFALMSSTIPIEYKYYGRLEAELIKKIDPKLAKYTSHYGINFYDPVPLSFKLKGQLKNNTPIFMRPLARKIKSLKKQNFPSYLTTGEAYNFLDTKSFILDDYFDRSKIDSLDVFSRFLTLEIFLQDKF